MIAAFPTSAIAATVEVTDWAVFDGWQKLKRSAQIRAHVAAYPFTATASVVATLGRKRNARAHLEMKHTGKKEALVYSSVISVLEGPTSIFLVTSSRKWNLQKCFRLSMSIITLISKPQLSFATYLKVVVSTCLRKPRIAHGHHLVLRHDSRVVV